MSNVQHIGAPHAKRVVAVIEELLEQAKAGEFVSIAFATENSKRQTFSGVEGLWRGDPARFLGELSIIKARVSAVAAKARYG